MSERFMAKPTTHQSVTKKTKMFSFRCPIDLSEKIPKQARTQWLLEAIQEKLHEEQKNDPVYRLQEHLYSSLDEEYMLVEQALTDQCGQIVSDQLMNNYGDDIDKLRSYLKI